MAKSGWPGGQRVVIEVDAVDRTAANTVTGHSWPENLPTAVAVWAGAPADFDQFERIS